MRNIVFILCIFIVKITYSQIRPEQIAGDHFINSALVLQKSGNVFQYPHGSVQVNDTIYIGERIDSNPKIIRFNNPLDLSNYTSQVISQGRQIESMCYDIVNKKIYATAMNIDNSNLNIIEFKTNNLSGYTVHYTSIYGGSSPAIVTDGIYIYGITYTSPATLFKIRLSDWSIVATNTLVNSSYGHAAKINILRGEFYCTTGTSSTPYFIRVSMSDLSFTEINISSYVNTPSDEFVYIDDGINCNIYIAGEKIKDIYGGVVITTTNSNNLRGFKVLPSYGLFSFDNIIYSACKDGYLQVFSGNDKDNILNISTYKLIGYIPNEIFKTNSGKLFFSNWGSTTAALFEVDSNSIPISSSSSGGSAGVTSVFGRTGNVIAMSGDYDVSKITNAAAINYPNTFTFSQYITGSSPKLEVWETSASSGSSGFVIKHDDTFGAIGAAYGYNRLAGEAYIQTGTNIPLKLYMSGAERFRFNTTGLFELINLSSDPTSVRSGFGGFFIKNNQPYFMNSSGVSTLLIGGGTSQWTNDTYGINYLSNIGVGTTSTSGIKLSAYQNGTGYVASLVNQSSSGSGLWLSGGGDATYSLEVNNYAGTRRFGILGSGKIFSYGLTNSTSSNVLYYNSSTGEISYGAATGGTSQWVNDTYGINYTSGNVSVGAASSSSVKFKSSLNTADAYAGSFENSNASGNGLYIRGGYTNRYALAVDDYNTADLFSIMGDGKIYANKLTNSSTSYTLYYNTSTKEISYAPAPSGGGGDYWSKSSGAIFPTTTTDKLVVGKTTSSGEAMFEVQGKSAFSDEISVGTRLWMGGGSVVLNNVPGQLLLSTNMSTENDIALSVRSSVYNPSGSLFRVRGNGYIDIAFNDNSPTVHTASSGVLRAGSNGKLYWKTISGGEYDLTATGSGGGTPGGSINSIQYNNSGAFGGFGNVGTYTISLGKPLELENRLNHPSATGQGIVTYDYIEDRVYVGTYGAQMPINRQKTQTPTIATNMTLDWRNGANMSITLTTNVALSIQNIPDGESGTILVKQDATGNRNISFTVWADSGLNSLTQTKIGSITDINKVSNKYSTITYKRFAGVVTLVYGREN